MTRHPAPADPGPRRALLRPAANPEPALDTLVFLDAPLPGGGHVSLRLVPDRSVLAPDTFAAYLEGACSAGAPSAEALAALILGDMMNELLPRWLRVAVQAPECGAVRHAAVMEDRQPHWDNPALLGRLAPL